MEIMIQVCNGSVLIVNTKNHTTLVLEDIHEMQKLAHGLLETHKAHSLVPEERKATVMQEVNYQISDGEEDSYQMSGGDGCNDRIGEEADYYDEEEGIYWG